MGPVDIGPILPELSPLAYIVRPLAVYTVILVVLRLVGKREIGELAPGDLVVLLLLSETLQGAMMASNDSLLGGLLAAAVLLCANWVVGALTARHRPFEQLINGNPTILVYKGRSLEANMRREHISRAELDSQLRKQGIFNINDIDIAILEPNGELSVRRVEEVQRPLDTELPVETLRSLGESASRG